MSRRSRIALLASLLTVLTVAAVEGQERSDYVHQRPLTVRGPEGSDQRVLVMIPRRGDRAMQPPGERYPLVIALHGRGEADKGEMRGVLGFSVDYRLPVAYGALFRGELRRADYGGFVRDAHLEAVNAGLRREPFSPPVVVTPYVPRGLLSAEGEEARIRYMDWLAGPLLEQVRAALPGVALTPAGTGIDGVSMGGRIALEAGFRHPEAFGAVSGIQPAVRGDTALLAEAVDPTAGQQIRLMTSDDDPYLAATRALSEALRARHVPHELLVTPGPHGYDFNRGPGSIELLRFASEVLVREPATATAPAPSAP